MLMEKLMSGLYILSFMPHAASERNFPNYTILNNLEMAEIAWLVYGKSVLLAHIFPVHGSKCNPLIQTLPPLHKN